MSHFADQIRVKQEGNWLAADETLQFCDFDAFYWVSLEQKDDELH